MTITKAKLTPKVGPDDFTQEHDRRWRVRALYNPRTQAGQELARLSFDDGWEPFAVDDGILWVRKLFS